MAQDRLVEEGAQPRQRALDQCKNVKSAVSPIVSASVGTLATGTVRSGVNYLWNLGTQPVDSLGTSGIYTGGAVVTTVLISAVWNCVTNTKASVSSYVAGSLIGLVTGTSADYFLGQAVESAAGPAARYFLFAAAAAVPLVVTQKGVQALQDGTCCPRPDYQRI